MLMPTTQGRWTYFGPWMMLFCLVLLMWHAADQWADTLSVSRATFAKAEPPKCEPIAIVTWWNGVANLTAQSRNSALFGKGCVRHLVYMSAAEWALHAEATSTWAGVVPKRYPPEVEAKAQTTPPGQLWGHFVRDAFKEAERVIFAAPTLCNTRALPVVQRLADAYGYLSVRGSTPLACDTRFQYLRRGAPATVGVLALYDKGPNGDAAAAVVGDEIVFRGPDAGTTFSGHKLQDGSIVSCDSTWYIGAGFCDAPHRASAAGVLRNDFARRPWPVYNATAVAASLRSGGGGGAAARFARGVEVVSGAAAANGTAPGTRRRGAQGPLVFVTVLPANSVCNILAQTTQTDAERKQCAARAVLDGFVSSVAALRVPGGAAVAVGIFLLSADSDVERVRWEKLAADAASRHDGSVEVWPVFLTRAHVSAPASWAYNAAVRGYLDARAAAAAAAGARSRAGGAAAGFCLLHPLSRFVPSDAWTALPMALRRTGGARLRDHQELSFCVRGGHPAAMGGKVFPAVLEYRSGIRFLHDLYGVAHSGVDVFNGTITALDQSDITVSQQRSPHLPVVQYAVGTQSVYLTSPDATSRGLSQTARRALAKRVYEDLVATEQTRRGTTP
eukprot:Rhum_TRINITY_DN15024_c6_g1::Rhum_TRINITY_DN15024_c6_g1_i1::g.133817::m.133817